MSVTIVIPAFNEENRIGDVVQEVSGFVDQVLVVDDGSTDDTSEEAEKFGAKVVKHDKNQGYLSALKTGFQHLDSDVVVTLDADGEMDPVFIPDLIEPIQNDVADLVLGSRESVPRWSERFLSSLAGLGVDFDDTGTGFRALRSSLAKEMELVGVCPCGTFVLEARSLGARIREVPVKTREIDKSKKVAWKHFLQFWWVVWLLVRG